jgi:hypothetical protein
LHTPSPHPHNLPIPPAGRYGYSIVRKIKQNAKHD